MTETVMRTDGAPMGRSDRRKEDARLLLGRTNWTDNIQLPGTLYMACLRSSMAHAKILSIDASAALALEGVVHVFTGQDFPELAGSTCVWPVTPDIKMSHYPAICVDEVKYAGDVVAIVLADDKYVAVDAARPIDVDYEHLDAVVDMEEALGPGSPLVHPTSGTNECYVAKRPCGDYEAAVEGGRPGGEATLRPAAADPGARWSRAGRRGPRAHVRGVHDLDGTQIPHVLRVVHALPTGIPENRLRIVAPDVGGGFGASCKVYR